MKHEVIKHGISQGVKGIICWCCGGKIKGELHRRLSVCSYCSTLRKVWRKELKA